MVAQGNYYVFAFRDKNRNLIYDAGEPAGQYGEPKVVAAPCGGVGSNINIVIPESVVAHHLVTPGTENAFAFYELTPEK